MRLEHWLYTIPLRLRSIFRRTQIEEELDEELQQRSAAMHAAPAGLRTYCKMHAMRPAS
jgi:hypothetical protein